jgi:hypothetical protein
VVASDKLIFWLSQGRAKRLPPLVASMLTDMMGCTFSAPAIMEREVRLDGLFLPPTEERHNKTALILEAQMAAKPDFFLRPSIKSVLLLGHQERQNQLLRHWRPCVIGAWS